MVIIRSLGCNGNGIMEFKILGVVRKVSSRVQNLDSSVFRLQDSSLFRQQVAELWGRQLWKLEELKRWMSVRTSYKPRDILSWFSWKQVNVLRYEHSYAWTLRVGCWRNTCRRWKQGQAIKEKDKKHWTRRYDARKAKVLVFKLARTVKGDKKNFFCYISGEGGVWTWC